MCPEMLGDELICTTVHMIEISMSSCTLICTPLSGVISKKPSVGYREDYLVALRRNYARICLTMIRAPMGGVYLISPECH